MTTVATGTEIGTSPVATNPNVAMNSSTALNTSGIIPDIIDSFTPSVELSVTFPHGNVLFGNELKPSEAAKAPKITWSGVPGALYTLMMVDPDAPSRADPKFRCWRHWIVVNIPSGGLVDHGSTISSYHGPAPPKDTGDHRYVFLLFQQKDRISTPPLSTHGSDMGGFNPRLWAQQHQLTPVGANFFLAKNQGMLDTISGKLKNAM